MFYFSLQRTDPSMHAASHIIRTAKAEISLFEKDWLVKITIKEKADLTPKDILAIDAAKRKLVRGHKHCVLFIPPFEGSIDQQARELSASEAVNKNAIAKAIIAQTIASRLIGNFFIAINKPPAPTKLFRGEADALLWLRDMYEKNH